MDAATQACRAQLTPISLSTCKISSLSSLEIGLREVHEATEGTDFRPLDGMDRIIMSITNDGVLERAQVREVRGFLLFPFSFSHGSLGPHL